ncbi:dynein heavy chain, putative [Plasmodium ovale curtisi]|uniref:Dynein heavy chain, putative n=1 Tax=Plasmodium ovale curtisi TaxID=864141 RepID=A0A1A8VQA0_PLAOA|nr:dynein heavy chain, putative [Plasmodium ovale curtisi]
MNENSHLLSIGINDIIKKNVNKICTFIVNKILILSELNKNSKKKMFKEEIKRCLFDCGIYDKQCVYYLNDENNNFDFIMENLNNIYNYSDSYLLYNEENLKKIYNECKGKCEEEHLVRNITNIYNIYKKTIRKNFHVSLNISPNNANQILKYSYILKNSHIVYFEEDNEQGLHIVARSFFREVGVVGVPPRAVPVVVEEEGAKLEVSAEEGVKAVEDSAKTEEDSAKTEEDSAKTEEHSAKTEEHSAKTTEHSAKTEEDSAKTAEANAEVVTMQEVDLEVIKEEGDQMWMENIVENKIFIRIHKEMILLAKRYQEEKQVHVCINSSKYLHVLQYFDYFYNLKKKEFDSSIDMYSKALSKLHKCEQDIKIMKNYLLNMQPVLNSTNIEMRKKVNEIERDTKEAYIKQGEIKKKENEMKTKIRNITNLKNEVNEEISKSFTLLNDSLNNLNKLKVEHLRELKAFVNPPQIVVMVIQCILTFLKEDEKYLQGKMIRPKTLNYWVLAQKTIFRDSKVFLDNLKHYDKNLIEEEMIIKISPLIKNKNFNPKFVRKASKACETMCQWILAIYHYFIINKELQPKKEEVIMLENEINKELEYLDICKNELNTVNNNLKKIEKEKEEINTKQNELVDKIENIKQKIKRSKIILSCLLEQEIKWNNKKNFLKKKRELLIGDCIIVASLTNYVSYFSYDYRIIIKRKILKILSSFRIKYTKNISICEFLESKINLERWIAYGLTKSKFYFENVVIMNNSIKYNLLIDPHFIVTNFLKNLYHKKKDVEIMRNKSSNFIEKIERCMQLGNIILFTHYDDDARILFSALFNYKMNKSLLTFQSVKGKVIAADDSGHMGKTASVDSHFEGDGEIEFVQNDQLNSSQSGENGSEHTIGKSIRQSNVLSNAQSNCVNFNNKIITLSNSFNIYFIVYGNAHFDDTTQNCLNVVDFNINLNILEEYFLESLIEKLSKSSNEKRTALIHHIHDLNNQIVCKEKEILHILNYKEDILSDDDVVVTFENANDLFHENKKKIKEFKVNKKEIMKIRKNYISMSEHISVIYHCINNLVTLNPFYNTSILSFVHLLNISIDKSEENKLLEKRKKDILNIFTKIIHYEISRTLSEKHQHIFFFYLVCMINIYKKEIEYDDYYFFIYDDYPDGADLKNEVVQMVKKGRSQEQGQRRRHQGEGKKGKDKGKDKDNGGEKDQARKGADFLAEQAKGRTYIVGNLSGEEENDEAEATSGNERDLSSDEDMDARSDEEEEDSILPEDDAISLHSLESKSSEERDHSGEDNTQDVQNSSQNGGYSEHIEYMLLPKKNEKDDFMNSLEDNVITGNGVCVGGFGVDVGGDSPNFTFDFETKNLQWMSMKEYVSVKKLMKKEKYYVFFRKVFNEYEHIFRNIKTDHTIMQHKDIKNLLTDFEKLIIYKIFRFEILKLNMNNYVDSYLNISSQGYPKDLYKCYEHSSKNKLILILSEHRLNTASEIMQLSEKITGKNNLIIYNKHDKTYLLQILNDAIKNGLWVLIENAHLNIHLILEIEKYIEICNIQYSNPEFRIWISTNCVDAFPHYLLKLCVKVTFENVYNLKSCLLNVYSNAAVEEEEAEVEGAEVEGAEVEGAEVEAEAEAEVEGAEVKAEAEEEEEEEEDTWGKSPVKSENESVFMNKLNFSLCFFHALIQERNKFKNKGFNNSYEFTDIELKLSKKNICKFFQNKNIDINLLIYLIGNIIYGGIIIDINDQKCFNIILKKYVNEKVIYSNNDYKFGNYYYCPHSSNKNIFLRYIKSLQFITDFSIFNLHPSLNILYLKNYNLKILKNLQRFEYNTMKKRMDINIVLIIDVLKNILPPFLDSNMLNDIFLNNLNCSIVTFLKIEADKYNYLLRIIYDDLTNVINFVKGKVISKNVIRTYNSILNLCIPKKWITNSFYSKLQLFHFAKLIKLKISYIKKYLHNPSNKVFNLAAFISPKSLILAIREKFSREMKIDTNNIKLKYEISGYFNEEDIKEDSYFVGGLFIEGAIFDVSNLVIKESTNKQLYCPMPYIKIFFITKKMPLPKTKNQHFNFHIFKCPIYKNIHKMDNSLNNNEPIFYLKLNSKEKKEKWIERNVSGVLILK